MPINPTPPLVGGKDQTTVVDNILQDYVFQSGIHKPEHSNLLSYKYPQYYLTSMLDRLGPSEGLGQDVWSWNVMDRTRRADAVGALDSGAGTATNVITTGYDWTSARPGYLIVGDIIRVADGTHQGELLRVTASADSASTPGKQAVTVVSQAGTAALTLVAGDKFGHATNAFGEASDAPEGRVFLPEEEWNAMQIIRRSFSISGSEFTNRTWLNDGSAWYFTLEDLHMKEFALDREIALMWGVRQGDNGSVKSSTGLINFAFDSGIENGFAAAAGVAESDLRDHIKDLFVEGVGNEIYVLCGAQFLADVQVALRDYALAGAISYGAFGDNIAGLDFQSYKFMGKTIHFAHYNLFDDQEVLPSVTASATVVDYSNFSLWLDLGTGSNGEKLISLRHKELDGQSRKFIHAYEVGMMNPAGANGGQVANGKDAFTIHYLSEIGLECRLPNRLGILRANS
jgi:hypothetical protein